MQAIILMGCGARRRGAAGRAAPAINVAAVRARWRARGVGSFKTEWGGLRGVVRRHPLLHPTAVYAFCSALPGNNRIHNCWHRALMYALSCDLLCRRVQALQVWALRFGPYGEQLALTWDEGKVSQRPRLQRSRAGGPGQHKEALATHRRPQHALPRALRICNHVLSPLLSPFLSPLTPHTSTSAPQPTPPPLLLLLPPHRMPTW